MSDAPPQQESKAAAAAAAAAASSTEKQAEGHEDQGKTPMTAEEKKAAKQRMTRLVMYVARAKAQLDDNFTSYPCMGLHFGFGDKEIARLQAAVARHGREDQFDNLTVPVDVLLRMLSFIPNERDPRVHVRMREQQDRMVQKTMYRLAATSSTLLFTIMENKCCLGAKRPPSVCTDAASAALRQHREDERKKARSERERERERGRTTATATTTRTISPRANKPHLYERAGLERSVERIIDRVMPVAHLKKGLLL